MRNESHTKLHPWAFGFTSGIIGFIVSLWMGMGYAGTPVGQWMMIPVGSFFPHNWFSVIMAICVGITGLAFAWVYNLLAERMN